MNNTTNHAAGGAGGGAGGAISRTEMRERLHELRQPLQAARLFHGLLSRRPPTDDKDAQHLDRLGQALDALEQQVLDLQARVRDGAGNGSGSGNGSGGGNGSA